MGKHSLLMIMGCFIPLLLIFTLPLFGITGNYSFVIFIVAVFACHLMMPMHHAQSEDKQTKTVKTNYHESA